MHFRATVLRDYDAQAGTCSCPDSTRTQTAPVVLNAFNLLLRSYWVTQDGVHELLLKALIPAVHQLQLFVNPCLAKLVLVRGSHRLKVSLLQLTLVSSMVDWVDEVVFLGTVGV